MAGKTLRSILAAASLTALTLTAVATPASADTTGPVQCASEAAASGSTESNGQITYDTAILGTCGVLGVRVNYVHIGGDSWTGWTYCAWGDGSVLQTVTNAVRSQHSTSVGSLFFYSYR